MNSNAVDREPRIFIDELFVLGEGPFGFAISFGGWILTFGFMVVLNISFSAGEMGSRIAG
jgi:hypothetical protein